MYAQTMVAVLKACGNNFTRENVMKQAQTADVVTRLSTSANDFNPIKQMQLQRFGGTTWKLFGEVISASGS
jgi:branched-chain amino acid transport system substrate-binding protein